jgi:uncharacterized protein (DUF885 family)
MQHRRTRSRSAVSRHTLMLMTALGGIGIASPLTAQGTALMPALRVAADSLDASLRPAEGQRAWPDLSDSLRLRQRARTDAVGRQLQQIDRRRLDDDAQLLFDNLHEAVQGDIESRVCRTHLWYAPSAFAGWHITSSNWARNVSVGTDASRRAALDALRALPAYIAAERRMLQRGLDSGYVSSQAVIDGVIRQYDALLADTSDTALARSPFASPLLRDSSAVFKRDWLILLRNDVAPAVFAQRRWLDSVYRKGARAEGSLATLRDGPACYQAMMRQRTSLQFDPATLITEARAEVDRLHRQLEPMIRRLTDTGVSDGIRQLKSDPRFTFASRDSTVAAYRAASALAQSSYSRVVAGYAPESLAVIPYPEFQERAGVPPSYQRAPDDRSRPAWFLVNLARPERMAVANAVAHEGYPGHHLQRIAASQAGSLHPVMRQLGFGAFSEGWGIYAEDLGAEMGLYRTPLDSVGHLVHLLDVAVAYWLDAATHVQGWSRATLVDSMVVLGGRSRAQAGDYADRHAGTPGQLATYYVGYRVIRQARAEAEQQLGARFDVTRFNREVIRHGSITLGSLQTVLARWVERERRAAAQRDAQGPAR